MNKNARAAVKKHPFKLPWFLKKTQDQWQGYEKRIYRPYTVFTGRKVPKAQTINI